MRNNLTCIIALILAIGVAIAQPMDQPQPRNLPTANLVEKGTDGGERSEAPGALTGKSGILTKLRGIIYKATGAESSQQESGTADATASSRQPRTRSPITSASHRVNAEPIAAVLAGAASAVLAFLLLPS